MKKYFLVLIVFIVLTGCNPMEEASALKNNISEKTTWVYMQFNVHENNQIETYYYYGRVAKPLYDKIASNKITKGFILLREVKYWGNDNLIHDYKSSKYSGDLTFRIEDIKHIRGINKEPIAGRGSEQFDAPKTQVKKEDKKVAKSKTKK
ncbi:MAG: hypothetical protein GY760_13700 [Deltaproteobacteria bacterium]|nr:hypothetical protein [Deltaproteobacteria bacterium]